MAKTYEVPDNENREVIETLGPEVELRTFKTNIKPDLTTENFRGDNKAKARPNNFGERVLFKLVCVGDFSGSWSKGVYISDYIQLSSPITKDTGPVLGANFHLKLLRRRCELTKTENQIWVQLWDISECERFYKMRVFYENANGAIVFWGAQSSSFESALEWRKHIKESTNNDLPVVLMVDNVTRRGSPVAWIGEGKLMDSRQAMDDFCLKHGFIAWFEMFIRDWTSGENSVFGKAVSRLVDEVMGHREH